VGLYIHSPIRLHGVVLNYLSTGTTLPYLMGVEVYRMSHDVNFCVDLRTLRYVPRPREFGTSRVHFQGHSYMNELI
jgi:hypothetical protein